MTLLISMLLDGEIAVGMDTFGMGSADEDQHFAKCWAPDSGEFVVAGTGLADVVAPWLDEVSRLPHQASVEDVAVMTPGFLSAHRDRFVSTYPDAAQHHTTGYIYSFATDGRSPVRQSFSSRHSFNEQRQVKPGIWILPEVTLPAAWLAMGMGSSNGDFMRIARHVASECDRDVESSVRVDGDLRVVRINPRGSVSRATIGRIRG